MKKIKNHLRVLLFSVACFFVTGFFGTIALAGDRIMNKGDYADYISALKAHDYAGFTQYYADDYKAHVNGNIIDIKGVVETERQLAEVSDWTMDVHHIIADEGGISANITMDIHYKKDVPDSDIKAGDQRVVHAWALYLLRNGKITDFWFLPYQTE